MIIHTRIEGSQLRGNLLEDPTERDLFVYVPPGSEDLQPQAKATSRSAVAEQ
jgi:hypothetical protein